MFDGICLLGFAVLFIAFIVVDLLRKRNSKTMNVNFGRTLQREVAHAHSEVKRYLNNICEESLPKTSNGEKETPLYEAIKDIQPKFESKNSRLKTPVEVLAMLLKRQKTGQATYRDIAVRGCFKCAVLVDGAREEGRGSSKKAAKQAAAKKMLDFLAGVTIPDQFYYGSKTPPGSPSSTSSYEIVALEAYANSMRRFGVSAPTYEQENATGFGHQKTYIVRCTFSSFSCRGSGKSKKIAKQQAAIKMYHYMRTWFTTHLRFMKL